MNFKFLHAADLHLGSPLTGLALKDAEIAARFAQASRDALRDLVTRALDARVAFAVIAGDVYDGEWRDTSIGLFFNREIARLTRAGIRVFIVKGNHDAESVVTKAVPHPDGVTVFGSRKAQTEILDEVGVALHGWSYEGRATENGFTLRYPEAVPGRLNIGVLHTSCGGHPSHAPYAPCTVQELVSHGYDYWALGHVHEHRILASDPWIVYPGNLQGRSIRECGPKGAVFVNVADGRVAGVEPVVVDKARWVVIDVDVARCGDEGDIAPAVRDAASVVAAEAPDRLLAIRLRLVGRSDLHERLVGARSRLRDDIQAVLHHVHEDAWLERLVVATEPLATRSSAVAGLDPVELLAGLEREPAVRDAAAAALNNILQRMPVGVADGLDADRDLDALLAQARALVIDRIGAGA